MSRLRNRVALTILGALVIGGASGSLGVLYAAQNMPPSEHTASAADIQQTGGPEPTSTGTQMVAATATTTAATTVVPSPTSASAGQQVDLHGIVGSVSTSTNSFVLNQFNGTSLIVTVSAATQYQGAARSLSGLRSGWRAEVVGVRKVGGRVAAEIVNSSLDT